MHPVLHVEHGVVGAALHDAGLPVGAPPGVTPKPLKGAPPFSGPQGPFAGIAAGPDGIAEMRIVAGRHAISPPGR